MTLLFGWIAAGISSIFRIPQLVQILQTGRVEDLSFVSLLCQFIVCPLYIAHGVEIGDTPTVFMGTPSRLKKCLSGGVAYPVLQYQTNHIDATGPCALALAIALIVLPVALVDVAIGKCLPTVAVIRVVLPLALVYVHFPLPWRLSSFHSPS